MQKPNLDQMWEIFVKFSWDDRLQGSHFNILREKIFPLLSGLENDKIINWYSFLVHDRNHGVPAPENDNNPYFHLRFALIKDVDPKEFIPDYCVFTRKIEVAWINAISGLDTYLLKNDEIEEAWRIIGEQSEVIFKMLNIFKEDINILIQSVFQFLHFFANMTQVKVG